MKIERLLAILVILLQNKKVTSTYLADRFHVSKRTIYRDLTDLSLAGIPIMTNTGNDGGVWISEDYRLMKTLFNEQELQAIISGLLSLDSVSMNHKYQSILQKLLMDKKSNYQFHNIRINLSSHYKETLAPKIDKIQQAIDASHLLSFQYCSAAGEREIIVEPYLIVYEWSSWYILGYHEEKEDFRLYKLNRLWQLQELSKTFKIREIPEDKLQFQHFFTDEIQAVILFDASVKYRIVEEYGFDSIQTNEDGRIRFSFPFTDKEYLLSWVMSFQDKAELVEPELLRVELKERMKKILQLYEG